MTKLGLVLFSTLATLAACGSPMRQPGGGGGGDDVDAPGGGGGGGGGGGVDAPPNADSLVYAHSAGTLYKVDTTTFAETLIGDFSGIDDDVTDIAVDKNGAMVAITDTTLYSVDVTSAAGTQVKTLSSDIEDFTGLGYVPNPTDDASDLLVTASADGDVYSINPTTGAGLKIGNYGKSGSKQIASSGDIFGVRNFGTYATVKVGSSTNDYLAKIDTTGASGPAWAAILPTSDTGFQNIYGVGFWAGTIYGFDDAGDVLSIDPTSGKATKMDNNSIVWWGAGVTTNAPTVLQ
jgi:hypothetical protein